MRRGWGRQLERERRTFQGSPRFAFPILPGCLVLRMPVPFKVIPFRSESSARVGRPGWLCLLATSASPNLRDSWSCTPIFMCRGVQMSPSFIGLKQNEARRHIMCFCDEMDVFISVLSCQAEWSPPRTSSCTPLRSATPKCKLQSFGVTLGKFFSFSPPPPPLLTFLSLVPWRVCFSLSRKIERLEH